MKELRQMKSIYKNGELIYNSVIRGEISAEELNSEEASLLFGYLCEQLEQGKASDMKLISECAEKLEINEKSNADEIISRTYKRIGGIKKRIYRNFLRRMLIAAAAVVTFIVFSFMTASALGVDIVEQVKTIFVPQPYTPSIIFDDYDNADSWGNPKTEIYTDLSKLFNRRLSEYLYPTQFGDGIAAISVTDPKEGEKKLFTLTVTDKNGVFCQMNAANAEDSYLPMGYKYSTVIENEELVFTYTVSRSGSSITDYSLYTVYEGIQYTFYIHTGDWTQAESIIKSIKLP